MSKLSIIHAYTFNELTKPAQEFVLTYDDSPSNVDAIYNLGGEFIENDVVWQSDSNVTLSMLRTAPELLEVVEDFLVHFEDYVSETEGLTQDSGWNMTIQKAKSAISKVKGNE